MKSFWSKMYGRKNVNQLDWLLAIVCSIIALGALWISIGISVANAAVYAVPAFRDVVHGFAFMWKTNGMVISNSLIFYSALIFLVFGIVYWTKKGDKERIPGVVAIFISALGIVVFESLFFEFVAADSVHKVFGLWSYGLLFFILCLIGAIFFSARMMFMHYDLALNAEHNEKEEEKTAVVEEKVEEQPKIEEKVEKEPARVEEIKEEVKEEPEEEESSDGFKDLGARRRRIPFESKIKRCSQETREFYKEIVDQINLYKVSERTSIPGQTFNYKRNRLIFIMLAGFTLKVHFALDPKKFADSTMPVKDASDCVKYEQTPAYIKIKSGLASRRAIALVHEVMSNYKVPRK